MKINFKEKKDVSFKIGVGGYLEPEKRHLLKLFFGFLDKKIQKDYKVKNIKILIIKFFIIIFIKEHSKTEFL